MAYVANTVVDDIVATTVGNDDVANTVGGNEGTNKMIINTMKQHYQSQYGLG